MYVHAFILNGQWLLKRVLLFLTKEKSILMSLCPQNYYTMLHTHVLCTFECGTQGLPFESNRRGLFARGVAGPSHMTAGATSAPLPGRPVACAPGRGDPLPHQTTNHHEPRERSIKRYPIHTASALGSKNKEPWAFSRPKGIILFNTIFVYIGLWNNTPILPRCMLLGLYGDNLIRTREPVPN